MEKSRTCTYMHAPDRCRDCDRSGAVIILTAMIAGVLAVATIVLWTRVSDLRRERERVRTAVGAAAYAEAAR